MYITRENLFASAAVNHTCFLLAGITLYIIFETQLRFFSVMRKRITNARGKHIQSEWSIYYKHLLRTHGHSWGRRRNARWSACQTIYTIILRESFVIIHDLFARMKLNIAYVVAIEDVCALCTINVFKFLTRYRFRIGKSPTHKFGHQGDIPVLL